MEAKEKLIFAAILGAAIGDFLPTIGDSVFFYQLQKLKSQLNKKEITPEQFWRRQALYYYSTNTLYWLVVGAILYNIHGDYHAKLKAALWIIGGSAVFSTIHQNIKKDKLELSKKETETKK